MKEVKFRWVDKYLIHLTLRFKFAVMAIIPILTLIGLTLVLADHFDENIQQSQQQQAKQYTQKMSNALASAYQYIPDENKQQFLNSLNGDVTLQLEADASRDVQSSAIAGGEATIQGKRIESISRSDQNGLITVANVALPQASGSELFVYSTLFVLIMIIMSFMILILFLTY